MRVSSRPGRSVCSSRPDEGDRHAFDWVTRLVVERVAADAPFAGRLGRGLAGLLLLRVTGRSRRLGRLRVLGLDALLLRDQRCRERVRDEKGEGEPKPALIRGKGRVGHGGLLSVAHGRQSARHVTRNGSRRCDVRLREPRRSGDETVMRRPPDRAPFVLAEGLFARRAGALRSLASLEREAAGPDLHGSNRPQRRWRPRARCASPPPPGAGRRGGRGCTRRRAASRSRRSSGTTRASPGSSRRRWFRSAVGVAAQGGDAVGAGMGFGGGAQGGVASVDIVSAYPATAQPAPRRLRGVCSTPPSVFFIVLSANHCERLTRSSREPASLASS